MVEITRVALVSEHCKCSVLLLNEIPKNEMHQFYATTIKAARFSSAPRFYVWEVRHGEACASIFCVAVCISNHYSYYGHTRFGHQTPTFYPGGYPPRLVHLWFLRSHFDMGNWLRVPDSHTVHHLMKVICTLTPSRSPLQRTLTICP